MKLSVVKLTIVSALAVAMIALCAGQVVAQDLKKSDSAIRLSAFARATSGSQKTRGFSKNTALTSSRYFCAAGNWRSKHWRAVILL